MTTQAQTRNPEESGALRRELRFWEAIALSIAIMAPTAAMALNGTLPATLVGQAVPLAFIFATVGVMFVSYAFIRLTGAFSHAGSVYAFAGVTLGPRVGFFSGWALFGTYLAFTAASTAETGLFGVAFFQGSGLWDGAEWLVIALVAGAGISILAIGDIRVATRSLLGLEGISVTLIVILVVVIFVKLLAGSAPQGQGFTTDIFKLPSGTSLDTIATAAVFGFLSFAGFEGAAALGEETNEPTRNIPRAIWRAVLVAGGFYIVVIIAQTLGFGTNAAGVKAFGSSSAPLGDLSKAYVGSGLSDAINLGR
jgi:amino acid transporter